MINDVSDALTDWLEDLTGSRRTGSYSNGRWSTGSATSLSFKGVVQVATPQDLKVLREGSRNVEAIKIHTTFELLPPVDASGNGDIINYGGDTCLVHNVAHWTIGNYHEAIAVKQ